MAGASDPPRLDVKRFALIETLIPTIFNGALPALGIWLLGPKTDVSLWGADGAAQAMLMPTLMPSLIIPIVVTLMVRARLDKGVISASVWPPMWDRIMRFVPGPLWARAGVSAAVSVFVMLPIVISGIWLTGIDPLSRFQFIMLNMCCGFLTGLIVVPPIIIAALAEQRSN